MKVDVEKVIDQVFADMFEGESLDIGVVKSLAISCMADPVFALACGIKAPLVLAACQYAEVHMAAVALDAVASTVGFAGMREQLREAIALREELLDGFRRRGLPLRNEMGYSITDFNVLAVMGDYYQMIVDAKDRATVNKTVGDLQHIAESYLNSHSE